MEFIRNPVPVDYDDHPLHGSELFFGAINLLVLGKKLMRTFISLITLRQRQLRQLETIFLFGLTIINDHTSR